MKRYAIPAEKIRSIAPGRGSCIASDYITVDGHRVGYMYRDDPDNDIDSGWHFMSGLEDQAYVDNPHNSAIYEVNTIVNYDPEIVPFLDAPIGSCFARNPDTGGFEEAEFPIDPDAN